MKMCLCLRDFFRGWCWEVVGWGGRPIFLGSAGGRRVAEHPQELMTKSGAKATNFASYHRAGPGAGSSQAPPAPKCSILPRRLCGDSGGIIRGLKRGAGFSPSSPASVKVLQSESGDWRSSDWTFLKPTHILVFGKLAFCLLLPHPSPPSLLHILFSGKRFHPFHVGERRLSTMD